MKRSELKKLLKPLIKECIKEVMFEDGILSGIVSEVATGMGRVQIVETQHAEPSESRKQENFQEIRQKSLQEQNQKLQEHKRKLLTSLGEEAYNGVDLFEGTNPEGMNAPKPGAIDLGTPGDAGVDISSIMGNASKIWQGMK